MNKYDLDIHKGRNLDPHIQRIAKDDLGIDSLESRDMDELDFHDVSVWQIKKALENAYRAGQNSMK